MTAGNIRGLHVTRVTSDSFTIGWNPAVRVTSGYEYIVRDLQAHEQVTAGHTSGTTATVGGLRPGRLYNFGIQALPGGAGSNIHVTTAGTGGRVSGRVGLPRVLGGITYMAFAALQCVAHGWGLGRQWADWIWIEMHEAGWNPDARNPSSGAYGIAQALGHGTAATRAANGENNYGNYRTPDAVCRAANSGNGYAQVVWMGNYIAIVYGSPSNARAQYNRSY